MKIPASSELYRAVQAVMKKVPALTGDSRPEAMKEVAARLAGQGLDVAKVIATADPAMLEQVRAVVLDDFRAREAKSPNVALIGETIAAKRAKPNALVSGGSYTGMVASAVGLARAGHKVVLVEQRPDHTRSIRLAVRQGMLDTVARIDPELAVRVLKASTPLAADGLTIVDVRGDAPVEKKLPLATRREPDAASAPTSGKDLMASGYSRVITASDFEKVVEAWLKEKFPSQIELMAGKVVSTLQPDGNLKWAVETKVDGKDVSTPLEGKLKPEMVLVAEGSGSRIRSTLGILNEPTTPVQMWVAGVVHTTDPLVAPGEASMRVLYDEAPQAPGSAEKVPVRGVAISDGVQGTWVLTQLPPTFDASIKHPQDELNAYYFQRASLATGQSVESLTQKGAEGPIHLPTGSVPTAFPLQGRASAEAVRVLPDGTLIGFLGDAVETSTFQAGGGMNTAIAESLSVVTLMEDLQSGMSKQEAAARFNDAILERADSWAATGIPFFFTNKTTPEETKALVDQHLKAIRDWRKEGGDNPLVRLQKMLAENSAATAPIGPSLAA